MIIRLAVAIIIGAALGVLVGRTQSCQSGACPLTANPRRGALWGGLLGVMFALSLPPVPVPSGKPNQNNAEPAAQDNSPDSIVQVNSVDQFRSGVLGKPGKVVVDFYATWCGPCKLYHPTLEKMAGEQLPGVSFAQVDEDKSPEIAKEYGIEAMPTTIIFENGKEKSRFLGVQSEAELKQALGI